MVPHSLCSKCMETKIPVQKLHSTKKLYFPYTVIHTCSLRDKKIVSSKFDEKYEMHLVLWMLNELNC